LAEALRVQIEQAALSGISPLTASFGVATIRKGETIKDLMRRADAALYDAKTAGRNRVNIAS